MKKILFFSACILHLSVSAQNIGIGTTTPNAAARLDIQSNNSGVLIPRLTTLQKTAIASPPAGLMVYDNDKSLFSFYDGSAWREIKPVIRRDSLWDYSIANGEENVYNYIGQHLYFSGSPVKPVNGGGTIDGAFTVQHGTIMPPIYYNLTMDGKGLQARTKSTLFGPQTDANLILNQYGGNVGIGLSNPSIAKLHVNGFVGNTAAAFTRDANSQGISLVTDWPGIYFNSYYNNGPKSMSSTGYSSVINMDQNQGAFVFILATTANVAANQPLSLAEIMRITKEGKVGIGTANPTYPLSVNGTVQSKEMIVETNWSDYVFEDNYPLRSLAEVEQFIREHKHLPGISSAKEIQQNGLPLAAINTKMMEKIEELTLYIIGLNKKIEALERKISNKQ